MLENPFKEHGLGEESWEESQLKIVWSNLLTNLHSSTIVSVIPSMNSESPEIKKDSFSIDLGRYPFHEGKHADWRKLDNDRNNCANFEKKRVKFDYGK